MFSKSKVPQKVSYGRISAAGGGGILTPEADKILRKFRQFNTEDARAAFADKWVRLTSSQMDDMWTVFYELLRIIRDKKLYENSAYMEDRKPRATFEEYWEQVVQKPFTTWTELERTYQFVRDHSPESFAGTLSEATAAQKAATKAKTDREAVKEGGSDPLPVHGKIGRGRNRGVVNTSIRGSTNVDYLSRRLARDFPEVLAKVESGEIKSLRKAALSVGILKPTAIIPLDPKGAARAIRRHFKGEALTALIEALEAAVAVTV